MASKNKTYWNCQIIGWTLYTTINLLFFNFSYHTHLSDNISFIMWLPLGIGITHAYRNIIIKFNFLKTGILAQGLIITVASLLMAILFFILNVAIINIFDSNNEPINILAAISKILSLVLIFFVWSIIYFGFHFFDNYKKTEIQNLKLEANSKLIELNTLKSQLNPHFMFNSMNSIRALIDEDPKKAKQAIGQLSNILRHTLMMHKHKYISLEDELLLVNDYLALEHIRFEERLSYEINIDPHTKNLQIPPMMLQTLVENGIKHGISKYPEGGFINISTQKTENEYKINITNTGQLNNNSTSGLGFGIINTKERLELLYGTKAQFYLKNINPQNVLSEIIITT